MPPNDFRTPWFHPIANSAMRLVFPFFFKMNIEGSERAPKQGPLIVAINHACFLDPLMSIAYVRPDTFPMAKVELIEGPFGWVFRNYGAFPVRRGQADLGAVRAALRVLNAGHAMLISPEGHRAETGTLQTPHEGIAFLAYKSGAPILPVANWGGKAFSKNLMRLRRTPVGMRVGEPLELTPLEKSPRREVLTAITDELMGHIARMLPPEYRGRYSDAESMSPRYLKVRAQPTTGVAERREREVLSMQR